MDLVDFLGLREKVLLNWNTVVRSYLYRPIFFDIER
jgi:hypothetical protein